MVNFWFGMLLSEFEDPSPSKNHVHVTASTTSDSNYFKFIELCRTPVFFSYGLMDVCNLQFDLNLNLILPSGKLT